ncbi:MAG: hypothetical protein KDD70_10135 [Bdellovibrionales bacterium]|nr:hypothetical protein [Bdellovibrionales bacterium]
MSGLERIEQFKGVHAGKRLFILASGPSLQDHDLSRLERRIVMGLNRSFLAYPDTHYHCCMDQRLFDLHEDLMRRTRFLFTLEGRPWGIPMKLLGSEGFSLDLQQGVYSGYTISYLALQVAVYMGFSEVFYVGLDLAHKGGNTHFFGNDFHSRNHETTEFPKMARMLEYGAQVLTDKGIRVCNCSPTSTLDCFERVSFEYAVSL